MKEGMHHKDHQVGEPVPGVPQEVYNNVQVDLMKMYGVNEWFSDGMAGQYEQYAQRNPDQIKNIAQSKKDNVEDDRKKELKGLLESIGKEGFEESSVH